MFPSSAQYINIGKIVGTNGLNGNVVLKHALGKKTALKGLKAIFIKEKNGSYLPWFLESAKIKTKTETLIKIEGIDTIESARLLVQKVIWLVAADFEKQAAKTAPISLIGYRIENENGALGIIEEIIEQPHQILCRLHIDDKEVFIPLHQETLKKIDAKHKSIQVRLPDGLLNVYLSS